MIVVEEFLGGFLGGGVGVEAFNFLDSAIERFPLLKMGIAGEGGGQPAGFVGLNIGIEDDEGEVGEQGIVVVAEGDIGVAEGVEEVGEEFFIFLG